MLVLLYFFFLTKLFSYNKKQHKLGNDNNYKTSFQQPKNNKTIAARNNSCEFCASGGVYLQSFSRLLFKILSCSTLVAQFTPHSIKKILSGN